MALNYNRVRATAQRQKILCDKATDLAADIQQYLKYEIDQGIDWDATTLPSYIVQDIDGNLDGEDYSRFDVQSSLTALDWIQKLLNNKVMTGSQGEHLTALHKLASLRR
jgi:hypothetical protein